MEGVEILEQIPVYATILPSWCGWLIFIIIVLLPIMIYSLYYNHLVFFYVLLICCVSLIVIAFLTCAQSKDKIDHYEYKVIISDDISFKEFYDKYEIIKVEGKIYTVRERNNG